MNTGKKPYSKPVISEYAFDKSISLMMQSPADGWGDIGDGDGDPFASAPAAKSTTTLEENPFDGSGLE